MSQRDLLRLVLSNLNRMRARVALTAIGVIIGTVAVVLLISMGVGLQETARSSLDEGFGDLTLVQVRAGDAFGGPQTLGGEEPEVPLDREAIEALAALEHVSAATPVEGLRGGRLEYGRQEAFAQIRGVDPAAAESLGWELASGRPLLGRGQVVIGPKVFGGEGGFLSVGPGGAVTESRVERGEADEAIDMQNRTITLELSKFDDDNDEITRHERLRVAGVFEESNGENDFSVFMALEDVEDMNRWLSGERRERNPTYDLVQLKVDSGENVSAVQEEVEALGFSAFSFLSVLEGINQFFLIVQLVLGGVGAVALVVAAIGIANTMTMAIYERTREIGIMKALGATNRDVLRIFLAEAGAIGLLGGAIGVALGWGIGFVLDFFVRGQLISSGNADPESTLRIVSTPLWLIGFALAFAALVGLISGAYPALRAASMKPLRALRTE